MPQQTPPQDSPHAPLVVEPWEESESTCDCCGKCSRHVWGAVNTGGGEGVALYWVHWTKEGREHPPLYDLIVYRWNDDGSVKERMLVCLEQHFNHNAAVGVVDAGGRPISDNRELCDRPLARNEVIGTPLAAQVFSIFDAVWLSEPRIDELRSWTS